MVTKEVKNKFFYITFQTRESYKCTKLSAPNTIEAIKRFNKIYIIDCFLVNINYTEKVLPKEIEFLVMTCHPN